MLLNDEQKAHLYYVHSQYWLRPIDMHYTESSGNNLVKHNYVNLNEVTIIEKFFFNAEKIDLPGTIYISLISVYFS